ncbi:hypothetical protein, partial [Mordavella massiliensis]|uniref:hypothetical protein n=1 Tax=Mordavella massiliensis TaxID=1871024 RepID=UPI00195C9C89
AAAGNLPEQNKNNKCVNRPPETAVKKYAGTYDLPCTNKIIATTELFNHITTGAVVFYCAWNTLIILFCQFLRKSSLKL